MKCRLLYLVGQLGPGGLERQLYLLLRTMDRDRYRPEVVVWNLRSEDAFVGHFQKLGIPLNSFPDSFGPARKLRAFRQMVLVKKPALIHSYSFHTNFVARWASVGTGIKVLGSGRSDFISEKKRSGFLLGRFSARWPETQIFNNFAGAENARSCRTFFAPNNIFVVRNGLDLDQFRIVPMPVKGLAHIVGIGSLLSLKRWDRLILAASVLKQSGLEFRVEIAGDGPMRERLERQVHELRLADCVRLLGHTADIPRLLANSTCLAHTSDYEGCPNVILEAMGSGRPVVATDAGDVPSLVEDGSTGFLVRRGDDARLVDRLIALIRDRELCRRLGNAARAKAQREFSLDRLLEETFNAYRATGWHDGDEKLTYAAEENCCTEAASIYR